MIRKRSYVILLWLACIAFVVLMNATKNLPPENYTILSRRSIIDIYAVLLFLNQHKEAKELQQYFTFEIGDINDISR